MANIIKHTVNEKMGGAAYNDKTLITYDVVTSNVAFDFIVPKMIDAYIVDGNINFCKGCCLPSIPSHFLRN